MKKSPNTNRELLRIGKHLNELIVLKDKAGNTIYKVLKPVMLEVYPRDIIQLIVGATLLAVPVSFTEEVWHLGETLPWQNILLLLSLSVIFTALFVYYNFYRNHFKNHKLEFIKRIILLYLISLGISWLILYLIGQAPTGPDLAITIKRMIIISFPASMSAAIADMIK